MSIQFCFLYIYYVFLYMCYKYYGPQRMHGNHVEKVHFPSSICTFFALCFVTATCAVAQILESTWSCPCSLPAPFRKLHKNLLNLIQHMFRLKWLFTQLLIKQFLEPGTLLCLCSVADKALHTAFQYTSVMRDLKHSFSLSPAAV